MSGTVVWSPRPQDDKQILVNDVIVFRGTGGPVVLRFNKKSPFESRSAAPFLYEAATGDLMLKVVGPAGLYEFDCGIGTPSGVIGLEKAGDQIPVGN